MKLTDKFKVSSKDISKLLLEKLMSISTFNMERYYNKEKGKYDYGFTSFNMNFATDNKVSIEQEIIDMHESCPLGISFDVDELSEDGENIIGTWRIKKASISKVSFGGFDHGSADVKTISVSFLPTGVEYASGEIIKVEKKEVVQE